MDAPRATPPSSLDGSDEADSAHGAVPVGSFEELEPSTPPLIDAQGRVRLSFSRIDTHQNCPRKFRYAYIDRLPSKPSPALSFGSSIHAALEEFYDRKLPTPPSQEDLLGFLYDAWDATGFEELERHEQIEYYRHAQDVLRRYHRRVVAEYSLPVATEAWFELELDEAVVVGAIDRIDRDEDGELHVVDYKTNRRAQPRSRVAGSLQLAIYALACEDLFGRLPASVALDFVVADVVVRVGIDEMELDAARDAVARSAAAIRSGEFPPTPNRLCDWCDYRSLCPAWPDDSTDDEDLLGPAVARRDELRRRLSREVAELRALEDGISRISGELEEASTEAEAEIDAPRGGEPGVEGAHSDASQQESP